jgi:hypothetical protein
MEPTQFLGSRLTDRGEVIGLTRRLLITFSEDFFVIHFYLQSTQLHSANYLCSDMYKSAQ